MFSFYFFSDCIASTLFLLWIALVSIFTFSHFKWVLHNRKRLFDRKEESLRRGIQIRNKEAIKIKLTQSYSTRKIDTKIKSLRRKG